MALQKTPININFGQGVDTKTDPNQVSIGKFLTLQNMVFTKTGALTKRNGFSNITTLPSTAQATTLTTINNNLTATGSNLYAFSEASNQWLNQGTVQPVDLNVLPLVRTSANQTSPDSAVSSTGLVCLVYIENSTAYYQISDNITGQQIVNHQAIASGANNPRVFNLGQYFIITYITSTTLSYIAIPLVNPTSTPSAGIISSSVNGSTAAYDGYVLANSTLYLSWAGSAGDVRFGAITSTLMLASSVDIPSHTATLISVTADTINNIIYTTFYDGTNIYTASYSVNLVPILAVTNVATPANTLVSITSSVNTAVLQVFYENNNTYTSPYPTAGVRTDFISTFTVTMSGTPSSITTLLRSVGLASKSFVAANGNTYMLVAYGEFNQPTYFLVDSSGNIYMRLAYSNGGGYVTTQVLPSVTFQNNTYYVSYLFKDFLATTNKTTNNTTGTPVNAIYTQTGVNLAGFQINQSNQYSSEIASTLHLTGGQLWMYDGVKPVEHGFHVWPEDIAYTWSATGGAISAQPSGYVSGQAPYYYQFCYEWTDNQGNLHRSAPSIPLAVTTAGSGTTGSITIYVPTLRLTYKTTPNPVRIVGYRWSVAQQVYYEFTSVQHPILNTNGSSSTWSDGSGNTDTSSTGLDYVTIVDTLPDSSILGQTIIYTTGGVIEDIAAPASIASALYMNRLFLIDAEDPNLLWFSKQVIENVPVEMSDLLTLYIAPTSGAQGSTGPLTAISAMDDKLIMFKKDAIYYLTGSGPDNTGSNSDFSSPIFITSSVGTTNPDSIVLMPNGLMFQSDKGIWLLGRDLTTTYIGAAVEQYNSATVLSATSIPGVNQVRFILSGSVTLMYDYFQGQWATFSNLQAISSTLYKGYQTYINSTGYVFQETPGSYIDGSSPVLMSFTTSWIDLAGLQGYERFYFMYILGTFYTPFILNTQIAYDYNSSFVQQTQITPDNYSLNWGGDATWGSGAYWGGTSDGNVFEARLFPQQQKCESFQISATEVYDSSYGVAAGAGLSLSGLNLVVGAKKGYRTSKSAGRSFG